MRAVGTQTGRLIPVDRVVLEKTADLLGSKSAAAQALHSADGHVGIGQVRFFLYRDQILVEKGDGSTSTFS